MDQSTIELRTQVRIETLRELGVLSDAGVRLDGPMLREMARASEQGVASLELLRAVIPDEDDDAYERTDPKHPAYHSTHADIWNQREGK